MSGPLRLPNTSGGCSSRDVAYGDGHLARGLSRRPCRVVAQMTRRAFFATVFGVTATAKSVTAAPSVHHQAVLRPDDQAGSGYYSLCGESACHAEDAIGLSVHPKGFFAKDFESMAYRRVQVSIFPLS